MDRVAIEFALKLPPALNNMYVNKPGGGRFKSEAAKAWETEAGWMIKPARVGHIVSARYGVEIRLPDKMRGDIDGRGKSIIDLLVKLGITPDDRRLQRLVIERDINVAEGTCFVSAWPVT